MHVTRTAWCPLLHVIKLKIASFLLWRRCCGTQRFSTTHNCRWETTEVCDGEVGKARVKWRREGRGLETLAYRGITRWYWSSFKQTFSLSGVDYEGRNKKIGPAAGVVVRQAKSMITQCGLMTPCEAIIQIFNGWLLGPGAGRSLFLERLWAICLTRI